MIALFQSAPLSMSTPASSRLLDPLQGKMILAPLTRGGNLPFRRLCADYGMEVSFGEMVYARSLLKGNRQEQARLRRAPNEQFFGVQIATNDLEEGLHAAAIVAESGADFVDLNCGCPAARCLCRSKCAWRRKEARSTFARWRAASTTPGRQR